MEAKDRIKILKENIKKKEREIDKYYKETKKTYGKHHLWAYDEDYQSLWGELYIRVEKLKGYRLALKDIKQKREDKN